MRGGAPRSNLASSENLSDRLHTQIYLRSPHTGDFEELRNFGMCWTGKGAVIIASMKTLEQVSNTEDVEKAREGTPRPCGFGTKRTMISSARGKRGVREAFGRFPRVEPDNWQRR